MPAAVANGSAKQDVNGTSGYPNDPQSRVPRRVAVTRNPSVEAQYRAPSIAARTLDAMSAGIRARRLPFAARAEVATIP